MTTKPRRTSGGTSKPAEAQAADEQADTAAAAQEKAGDAPNDATVDQQADDAQNTLRLSGEPQPEKPAKGMFREETGLSQEAFAGGAPDTAAYGDDERNGKAMGIPTDTSGELRHREGAVLTAAHGGTERNGLATEMIESQTSKEFGGNGDPEAKLLNGGVRGEIGAGTGTPAPEDERPQYPSTLLTRSSSKAAPSEPPDVKLVTQPRLGDAKTSTDPTMAASTLPSMPGDQLVKYVTRDGDEVSPSDFFEVPEGRQGQAFRRVKHRISEVFTVRQVKTPSKRLLFTEGQLVPVEIAQTLIELHG